MYSERQLLIYVCHISSAIDSSPRLVLVIKNREDQNTKAMIRRAIKQNRDYGGPKYKSYYREGHKTKMLLHAVEGHKTRSVRNREGQETKRGHVWLTSSPPEP